MEQITHAYDPITFYKFVYVTSSAMDSIYSNITSLLQENFKVVAAGAGLFIAYVAYYLVYVVQKPVIACGDAKLRQFLDAHCPIAKEKFWPTWWGFEGRVQTLLRAIIQSCPRVDYTGSESYILHMVEDATALGYRSVVFNNRGTCGTPLKTPRTYCAANTEDTALVMSYIQEKYPGAPLMAIGISLGGMILFNYMAHYGKEAQVSAAMCISANWNIPMGVESLESPINYHLFNRALARALCCLVEKHVDVFEKHPDLKIPHVLKSQTIRDFDERFTSKLFGYESVDHYYDHASLHTKVHALGKPVLCLNAADDPFSPAKTIPLEDAEKNDNIAIVMTSHGGHIGFVEGWIPRHRSYMYRWVRQFVPAVFEHGIKNK
ncbi:abhydrolase domain-containing protein 3 [Elysia marginata]|uniref:Abhydrolase domain-containing protein 3 n=1 Tax=Elysia marginata TaxID=1093978 RepID=A0AAV4IQM2_9GAST|nr:abhydrolase domain-containing protein 3 [Elysia marginata]